MRRVLTAGALTAIATLIVIAWGSGCGQPAPPAGNSPFTILTYNVNYHMPQPDKTIAALRAANADIVCLQETTPEWEERFGKKLSDLYGHMRFRRMAGAGGLGVLSKHPVREIVYHQCSIAWHPGWLVEIDTPAGPATIFTLHLHPPKARGADGVYRAGARAYFDAFAIRRKQIEELLGKVGADCQPIVVGDFNEPESGGAVSYACRTRGLRSALAGFDAWGNTWHSRGKLIRLEARLDHLLYPSTFRCLDARILKGGGSDHQPVIATFQFAPATPLPSSASP